MVCCLQALGDAHQPHLQEPTGLALATLQWVGQSICNTPEGFTTHPYANNLLAARR